MQNKYAAKIDLSSFFDDERKFVLILIDSAWENVECLQKRIEKIFEIEGVRFSTKDGYFLPPQENIEVVKFADIIKAFIPSESLAKKRKKSQKKLEKQISEELQQHVQATEGDETLQLTEKKKRKFLSLDGFLSSTPNQAKRTKKLQNIPVTLPCTNNKTNEITSTSEQLEEIDKKKKCTHTLQSVEQRSFQKKKNQSCIEISHTDGSSSMDGSFRKPSQHFSQHSQIPSSTLLQESSKSQKQQCTVSNENSDNSQNIFHDESGDIDSTTTQKNANETMQNDSSDKALEKDVSPKEKIIMRSTLEESITQKPRVFEIKGKKSTIEIREQIILTKSNTNDDSITYTREHGNDTIETEPIEIHQTTLESIGGEEASVADVVDQSVANNSAQSDANISNIQQTAKNSIMEHSDANISIIEQSVANNSNIDQSNSKISIMELTSNNSIMEQSDAKNSVMEQAVSNNSIIKKSDANKSKQTPTNVTMEQSDATISTMEQSDANFSTMEQSDANISTMAKTISNNSNIVLDVETKLSTMKPKSANNTSGLEQSDENISTVEQSTKYEVSIEKNNVSVEKTQEELEEGSEVSSVIDLDEEEDDESNVIDLSEIEYDDNPITSKQSSHNKSSVNTSKHNHTLYENMEEKLTIEQMLPFSIALEKMPHINDIVLFKAFCNGKGFLITKYIAGKCEYTNKRTNTIKLSIIDGQSQVQRLPSKLIVNLDDSVSEILYVNIKLTDMLEPRIFSSA